MKTWSVVAVLLTGFLALAAAWAGAASSAQPGSAPERQGEFLRGVTITCPGAGRIWGTPAMREAVEEVRGLGARWVSIHPYSWIRRSGAVEFRPARDEGYLTRAVGIARDEGVELFWKPHVGYWGQFPWRGEIEFSNDPRAWRRFFDDYRAWIVDQARFAEEHQIPIFAVGVELEGTTSGEHGQEAAWRRVIAEVRRVYSGSVTYSANWDRLEQVPFWDAVDLISVQAYFPLSQAEDPSSAEIRAGWDRHLEELRRLSAAHGGKKILFAELGYNPSPDAARQPWDYGVERSPETLALQRRLMEVALDRLEREPVLAGIFWWKWMPGSRERRHNFSLRTPEVRAILQRAWAPQSAAVENGAGDILERSPGVPAGAAR